MFGRSAPIAVLVAAAGLTGCQSAVVAGPDRMAPSAGPRARVVSTITIDADLKHPFATISELARSPVTTSIVVGTVRTVDYEYADGLTNTHLTVDVTRTLKGTARGRIVVNEDGGYADVRTMQAENQSKFPNSPITGKPGDVVDERFGGAEHPIVGQEVLLFLTQDPNKRHVGEFQGVMSAVSRFTSTDGSHFQRAGTSHGLEADTTVDAVIADLR